MTKEEFYNYLKGNLNIIITENQKVKLEKYANILIEYNKHTNITAITKLEDIYLKHFYDSISLVKGIDLTKSMNVLDIGSGGGFPGLVLAIMFPNLNITLLDSNHKKSDFQKYVINELEIGNVIVENKRAEDFYKDGNKYDLVVARAVAVLPILTELCLPFVATNGYFIAMKGESDELNDSLYAIDYLGGVLDKKVSFKLPIIDSVRNLYVIKKIKITPKNYPRSYNKILKSPLIKK